LDKIEATEMEREENGSLSSTYIPLAGRRVSQLP